MWQQEYKQSDKPREKLADLYFFQIDNLPNLVFFQKI